MEANWVTETIAYKGINKSYGTFFQNHIYSYHDAIVSIFYEKKNYNQIVYIVDETIIRYEQYFWILSEESYRQNISTCIWIFFYSGVV